jgi:hypothetical protein
MNSKAGFIIVGLAITLASVACPNPHNINGPAGPTISSISPKAGASFAQTTVNIEGTGFSGATVRFGGQTATVLSLTNTHITVLTPSNLEGAVDVVVTNANGDEARVSGGFTFSPLGVFAVKPQEALPSNWVTVVGAGFLPGARLTVGGVEAAIRATRTVEIDIVVPICPPGVVDVSVTNPDGRSATLVGGFTCQTVVLTPSTLSVSPGGPLTISWSSPVPSDDYFQDEIRMYRVADGSPTGWVERLTGSSGTIPLNAPTTPGDYEFRFLLSGLSLVSKSAPVSVR